MQSEDFDKKIRDAADNHHPSYDEKAWTKMEKLLDKHLPVEKKDNRRGIFLLLFLLLLGGGAWLLISPPWKQSSTLSQTQTTEPVKGNNEASSSSSSSVDNDKKTADPASAANNGSAGSSKPMNVGEQSKENATTPAITTNDKSISAGQKQTGDLSTPAEGFTANINRPGKASKNRQQDSDIDVNTKAPAKSGRKNKGVVAKTSTSSSNSSTQPDKDAQEMTAVPVNRSNIVSPPPVNETKIVTPVETDSKPAASASDKKETKEEKEPAAPPVAEEKEKKENAAKKKKTKTNENGLFLTASAGPDISAVGFDRIGKVRPVVGVGLAYTFAKQFTLRTGFYTASKVYTAGPNDYKPAIAIPTPQYLDRVDANCKVYEIPVTIAWNFARTKKHKFFGAAGLSSYLMKEEKYDYTYKYTGGTTWSYNWTIKDENKHIFSVVSLSGGYTRKLGKVFSVTAEPYLKLPLSGVGLGKVKLNSGGLLITVNAKLTGNK